MSLRKEIFVLFGVPLVVIILIFFFFAVDIFNKLLSDRNHFSNQPQFELKISNFLGSKQTPNEFFNSSFDDTLYKLGNRSLSSSKVLRYLSTPKMYVSHGYIIKENFECFNEDTNEIINLLLCFDAVSPLQPLVMPSEPVLHDAMSNSLIQLNTFKYTNSKQYIKESESKKIDFYRFMFPALNEDNNTPILSLNNKIRQHQQDFAELVFEFLDFLGISWVVGLGTLLGALRHTNIIPWDDDIDVGICLHEFSRIQGFLCRGVPLNQHISLDVAASEWWTWYITNTPLSVREEADRRYRTRLGVHFRSLLRWPGVTLSKLYEKDGFIRHEYPWTHPFVDLFVFEFINTPTGRPENHFGEGVIAADLEKFSYIYRYDLSRQQHISSHFPVYYRPIGHISVPVENNPNILSDDEFEGALCICTTSVWSHFYETASSHTGWEFCRRLYNRIPFITERSLFYIERSNLPKLPYKPPRPTAQELLNEYVGFVTLEREISRKNITSSEEFIERRRNANVSMNFEGLPPIQKIPKDIVVDESSWFSSEDFSALKTKLWNRPFDDTQHVKNSSNIPVTLEKLTISNIIIAELLTVTGLSSLEPLTDEYFFTCK